jgi:hypothetical protein
MDSDPERDGEKRAAPPELKIEEQVVRMAQGRMATPRSRKKLMHPWILLALFIFIITYMYALLWLTSKDQMIAIAGTIFVLVFIMGFVIFATHTPGSAQHVPVIGRFFEPRESRMSFGSGLVAPMPDGD